MPPKGPFHCTQNSDQANGAGTSEGNEKGTKQAGPLDKGSHGRARREGEGGGKAGAVKSKLECRLTLRERVVAQGLGF